MKGAINKLKIFDAYSHNYDNTDELEGIKLFEESCYVKNTLMAESWKSLDPHSKQKRRKRILIRNRDNPDTVINLKYYEKMIESYSLILDALEKLGHKLSSEENIENAEMGLLRIYAVLQVTNDFIDEELIFPTRHLPAHLIENLATDLHETYPDLNLPQLAKTYSEMYELWPGKPDLSLKQPAKTEPEK